MIAFDTDLYSILMRDTERYRDRMVRFPIPERCLPIVVVEEVLRGWLNAIRKSESGKGKISLDESYLYFEQSILSFRDFHILSFSAEADGIVQKWKQQKIKVGTQDMRIGAICICHNLTLITRNHTDFGQLTGLTFEVWKDDVPS